VCRAELVPHEGSRAGLAIDGGESAVVRRACGGLPAVGAVRREAYSLERWLHRVFARLHRFDDAASSVTYGVSFRRLLHEVRRQFREVVGELRRSSSGPTLPPVRLVRGHDLERLCVPERRTDAGSTARASVLESFAGAGGLGPLEPCSCATVRALGGENYVRR